MRRDLVAEVWRRARNHCEYCRVPQSAFKTRFQVDHIIAIQHGGMPTSDNLALACYHCNRHKGPNVAGVDPDSGNVVRLFHPRRDSWRVHFVWHSAMIQGCDDIGRATVITLHMNDPLSVAVREALLAEGQMSTE